MRLEAEGEENRNPKSISFSLNHEDPYFSPPPLWSAACSNTLKVQSRPILKMMAHAVDPSRTIEDLQRMGIRIETDTN